MNASVIIGGSVFLVSTILAVFILTFKERSKGKVHNKKWNLIGEKGDYFRDIPCKWDLDLCYFVTLFFEKNIQALQMNFISAKALMFYRKQKIDIKKDEKGEYYLDLNKVPKFDNEVDKKIYYILLAASSSNHLLSPYELQAYLDYNYASVMNSFDEIHDILGEKINEDGLNIRDEYVKVCGLRRFIIDFSQLPELDHEHVHLRDEYLAFATLYDLTSKIEKDFKDIYPFTYNNPLLDISNAKPVYGNNMYEDKLLAKYPWLREKQDDFTDRMFDNR